jgi:hypothetical protein
MDVGHDADEQEDYVSYLLRMWRDSSGEGAASAKEPPWRASLQSPRSGKRVAFASLKELFCFLQRQAGLEPVARDEGDDGSD